jgi:hypothetical protein
VYKLDPFLGFYKAEDEPCTSNDIPFYKFSSATVQALKELLPPSLLQLLVGRMAAANGNMAHGNSCCSF